MARKTTLPLLGPDIVERSAKVNNQRTVNMWPRIQGPGAKSMIALYSTPGYGEIAICGLGPNRSNGVVFQGKAFFVSGAQLYSISDSNVPMLIGNINTSSSRVVMKAGRDYLCLVDGTNGWTYDGTTLSQITDLDFPANPTHVAYIDGYFVVNKGDSDEFYISTNEDPTSWNALDFGAAAAKPDNCLALTASEKDLYIVGGSSIQVYYNSGNPDFPFTYYTGGMIDIGIIAPYSLVEGSQGIFFLSTAEEGGVGVVHVQGFQATVISDQIASDLDSLSIIHDAEGMFYKSGSRSFYQLSFPIEDKTFEYLVEDRLWVERKSYQKGRYRLNGHVYHNNRHIFGDSLTGGKYYQMDPDVFQDNGGIIERIRKTQTIHSDGRRMTFHELVLEIEGGVGLVTGETPFLFMRYSDDGGRTWSSELWATMGKVGEYGIILQWNKLGQSRERVFEFKVTDPVNVTIINAYAKVTVHND